MKLNEYQEKAQATDLLPHRDSGLPRGKSIEVPLLGLAGEVGELVSEYKKCIRDEDSYSLFRERVEEELGDILWYLANVAQKFDMELEDVAKRNLTKIQNRWSAPTDGGRRRDEVRPAFDRTFPNSQRLPRQMTAEIRAEERKGRKFSLLYINGEKVGDDLRDLAYEDDGYRFHDVFHLAYAAVLQWSPILRSLMGRRRESVPTVNDVEDGGRAKVIEEGIAALVYSYAEKRLHFRDLKHVHYELLRTIKQMTAYLEVDRCSAKEWEDAILQGFEVWRQVLEHEGGRIRIDLDAGRIEFLGPLA